MHTGGSHRLILALFATLTAMLLPAAATHAQQRQAQLPWKDRAQVERVGAYHIATDLPAKEANELARHLNLMYAEYRRRLASLPPRTPERLNVLIFAKRRDYLHVLRTEYGVDGTGSGGMFFVTGRGTALAFWTENLPRRRIEHVLQHEGFHQFAYSRFGSDLPIWVNEGLAEFFGEAVLVGKELVIGQTTPNVLDRVRNAIEEESYVPFRQMISMSSEQWGSNVRNGDASLQYHQAWSMVHFLIYGEDGRYQRAFEQYLKLMNNAVRSEDAFIRAFGAADLEGFERKWREYAAVAKPSAFVTALERMEFLAEGLLELKMRGETPETFEQLKMKLKAIDFQITRANHAVSTSWKANQDELYTIPMDDLAEQQPVFEMTPPEPPRSRRVRLLEEENPTPPGIATRHLRPRGLRIEWIRLADNSGFTYRIVPD